ncbi:segregation/condensation protein A [Candidatus Kaiserbacteria bacterium]|nr:segregation/condensation protein A [Candidatus Kaiserbacteria bacterium]
MPFAVKLGEFDGPLDLLLGLIEVRKMHINDVSLSKVTDDYLAYVQQLQQFSLGEAAQFVLVAATLLLIKSRSLLPNLELTNEEEGDVAELERRLKRYQIIKHGARLLTRAWGVMPLRTPAKAPIRFVPRFTPGDITLAMITGVLQKLVQTLPTATFRETAQVQPTVTLEEMIDRLKDRVMRAAKMRFKELTKDASRADVVIQFLALLELVRGGVIAAEQDRPFSDIMLQSDTVGIPRYGN